MIYAEDKESRECRSLCWVDCAFVAILTVWVAPVLDRPTTSSIERTVPPRRNVPFSFLLTLAGTLRGKGFLQPAGVKASHTQGCLSGVLKLHIKCFRSQKFLQEAFGAYKLTR